MSKWNNVPGFVSIYLFKDEGEWYVEDTTRNEELTQSVRSCALNSILQKSGEEDANLVLEFKSSGYHQPMSMYGGPDRLGWPEEGDEERFVYNAYLEFGNNKFILSKGFNEAFDVMFETEIYESENLDWPEEDYYYPNGANYED